MTTSRAAVVRAKGGPLQIEDVELGEPRAEEVLVRTVASGICHTDIIVRDQVLPPGVPARLAVEAAAGFGWSRWVGEHGEVVSRDDFGASAPGELVLEKFGFTPDNVADRARRLLARLEGGTS